jgi:hypothetical protein
MSEWSDLPAELNIRKSRHSDLDMPVDVGFDITGYTIRAFIVKKGTNDALVQCTIVPTDEVNGQFSITLTDTQVDALPDSCKWYLKLSTGQVDSCYLGGVVTLVEPSDV